MPPATNLSFVLFNLTFRSVWKFLGVIEMKSSRRQVPAKAAKKEDKEVIPDTKKNVRGRKKADTDNKNVQGKDTTEEKVIKTKENDESEKKVTRQRGVKKEETNGEVKERPSRKKKIDIPVEEEPKPKGRKKATKDVEEKSTTSGPMNSTSTKWDKVDFSCKTKNAKGQMANLKISCWNVGGLKSWVKKDCLKYLHYEDPDIFCLQETKCSEQKLPEEIKELEEYKQYWCASKKEGYAGVGILSKKEPLNINYGINVPNLDEDGRCITAEYDNYYLVNVYVPNAGRKLVTLPKRLEWNDAFKDYIKSLDDKKPVIICGDMNVAHNEIDIARPSNNTKNAGFTKEEREGMSDFLEDGYTDIFRKLYPDKADMYTFWSYMSNARAKNIGWRLDYFIVSDRIADKVCDDILRSDILGSDHCPLTLFINI